MAATIAGRILQMTAFNRSFLRAQDRRPAAVGQHGTVAGFVGKVGNEPDSVDQEVSNWLATLYI